MAKAVARPSEVVEETLSSEAVEDTPSSEAIEEVMQEPEQDAAPQSVEAPVSMLVDEYSGQGGSYTFDRTTEQRTLVQRTQLSAIPE